VDSLPSLEGSSFSFAGSFSITGVGAGISGFSFKKYYILSRRLVAVPGLNPNSDASLITMFAHART
jgi:hypothetical protein